jgi:transposase
MTNTSISKAEVEAPAAGIDVGKHRLQLGFSDGGGGGDYSNDAEGHIALIAALRRRGVVRVGMESTANYSTKIAQALREAGFIVNVFQPRQVKAFAQFKLKRAKTDKIDAVIIAQCTALSQPQATPDARLADLCAHLTLVEQIGDDVKREKTRLEQVAIDEIRAIHREEIKRLKLRRRAAVRALVANVRLHDDLAERMELILSIDGIGELGALTLVLRMPELGSLSREQAAALLGVAPFAHESGQYEGERHIAGGRARARRTLFAAAQVACRRWNPALMALYNRLIAKGRHHTAAVIACTRKLVVYANAVLARGKPWTKNLEPTPA